LLAENERWAEELLRKQEGNSASREEITHYQETLRGLVLGAAPRGHSTTSLAKRSDQPLGESVPRASLGLNLFCPGLSADRERVSAHRRFPRSA
jgi:hypothetical protein